MNRSLFIGSSTTLLILFFIAPSQSAGQSEKKQNTSTQQQAQAGQPSATKKPALPAISRENRPYSAKPNTTQWWQRAIDDPVAVITMLILIVYIGLFFIGWHQTKAVIKSAEAAKESADAALLQAKRMEETVRIARLDQRAWVGVVGVMHTALVSDFPFEVGVNIINSGKTPAKGTVKMRVRMLPEFMKPDLADAAWVPGGTRSDGIFFPNALNHLRNYVRAGVEMTTLTKANVASIQVGMSKVFVDGRIDYVDVFDAAHWTEFRFVWNAIQDVFTQCSEGNGTDDEWVPRQAAISTSSQQNDTQEP
ncbi:MAG: hypothetical protein AABO58_24665 [Acidobacteriota bacterium]